MGKRYDAKKVSEFIEDLEGVIGNYEMRAEARNIACERYCNNDTYVGGAANASKRFMQFGQIRLQERQYELHRKLLNEYREIESSFKDTVDPYPNARIDTDVLQKIRRDYRVFGDVVDTEGYQLECITRDASDKFRKYNRNLDPIYFRDISQLYEEFCGAGGFLDDCIRKVEMFDENAQTHLRQSGIKELAYDLHVDIRKAKDGLNSMQVRTQSMKKHAINITPVSTGAALGAATLLNNRSNTNSKNKASALKLSALNAAMPSGVLSPEIVHGVELIIYDILEAGGYALEQIQAVAKQIPLLLTLCASDGAMPIGEIIALGILAIDAVIIIIRVGEYLWDNHCIQESRKTAKSGSKAKNKGKAKDKQKEKTKQDPPSKSEGSEESENQDKKPKSKPNSRKLRRNMKKAGMQEPNYPNAAHHIVAGGAAAAKEAREILEKFNIDINDPNNGVFLPTVRGVSEATYHPAMHGAEYYEKVTELLEKATSREDCIEILRDIAEQLMNGTF